MGVELGGGVTLEFMPLGSRWAVDPFVILHNAVRRELLDLVGMIDSIDARTDSLDVSDKDAFADWWGKFQQLVTETFGIENRMVFPWVFGTVMPNGKLDPAMVEMKSQIIHEQQAVSRKFMELSLAIQSCTALNMKETFAKIVPQIRSFTIAFVVYYKRMEKLLISVIEPRFKKTDVQALEGKIVSATLAANPGGQDYFCMLYRGCATVADQQHVQSYLSKAERASFKRWYQAVDKSHFSVAQSVYQKNPDAPAYLNSQHVGAFSPRASGRLSPGGLSPRQSGAISPRQPGAVSPRQSGALNASGGLHSPRSGLKSPRDAGKGGGLFGSLMSPRKKNAEGGLK
mmetsp:Transcript_12216/g.32914  ORF Transcript_12216/g.32914 Transcript_12216/m.32914 type:complete len:343 (-) Transcript_12216:526-1554(-)